MTNFEMYKSSKYKLALLLAIVEVSANDFPNEIDKWYEWLDKEYDPLYSACENDEIIKKCLFNKNGEDMTP